MQCYYCLFFKSKCHSVLKFPQFAVWFSSPVSLTVDLQVSCYFLPVSATRSFILFIQWLHSAALSKYVSCTSWWIGWITFKLFLIKKCPDRFLKPFVSVLFSVILSLLILNWINVNLVSKCSCSFLTGLAKNNLKLCVFVELCKFTHRQVLV